MKSAHSDNLCEHSKELPNGEDDSCVPDLIRALTKRLRAHSTLAAEFTLTLIEIRTIKIETLKRRVSSYLRYLTRLVQLRLLIRNKCWAPCISKGRSSANVV